jgi:hypothetical protein
MVFRMIEGMQMSKACKGYTYYAGMGNNQKTYVLDMDGNVIHTWEKGGMPVKLLPGGRLICTLSCRKGKNPLFKDPEPTEPKDFAPWHDTIELGELDWAGDILWSFSNFDDDRSGVMMSRQHHDFQRQGNPVGYYAPGQPFIENGNTLILAHLNKNVGKISNKRLVDDVIYEIDSKGRQTGFEWHAADHFDEFEFDNDQKAELFEAANYDAGKDRSDWIHLNSVAYLGRNRVFESSKDPRFHPENLIFSARNTNFIAIIDKQTGKIVWKAGPHWSKDKPEGKMGQLVGQHHVHMIPSGLPGEGNLLIFDNGGMPEYKGAGVFPTHRGFSRVIEVDPLSFEVVWQYGSREGVDHFFSHFISSAQRLPNGNTLITAGALGWIFEVTVEKEIVWQYKNPISVGPDSRIYRAHRVPPEWIPVNPGGYPDWENSK